MLDKLRKKLTLLCICITAAIMITFAMIAFFFAAQQLNKRSQLDLQNQLASVSQHLQTASYVSHAWLTQQELNNHCVISISSRNNPFTFSGAYSTITDRTTLIENVREIGCEQYSFEAFSRYLLPDDDNSVLFSFHTASEDFLATIAVVTCNDQPYEIIIIKDMEQNNAEITHLKYIFISLLLCGILLLGFFSWWFAGNAIKPIQVSRQNKLTL